MSATYSCAGTKSVAIDGGDGLVTVFHYVEEKSRRSRSTVAAGGRKSSVSHETDVLHVLVTDGLHTFYERWVVRAFFVGSLGRTMCRLSIHPLHDNISPGLNSIGASRAESNWGTSSTWTAKKIL